VTLDDGERPLRTCCPGSRDASRRWCAPSCARRNHAEDRPTQHDFPARDTGIPTYEGLPLDRYVSIMEMLNPCTASGRTAAGTRSRWHSCYWKKCSFCDVSLDYIGRYDKPGTEIVMQRIGR
jgi:hypothetical protein